MDMRGITVLVHFNVPDDLPTLVQRFGRAARNPKLGAVCILLIQPGYFYAEREAREKSAEKTREKKRRKTAGRQNAAVQGVLPLVLATTLAQAPSEKRAELPVAPGLPCAGGGGVDNVGPWETLPHQTEDYSESLPLPSHFNLVTEVTVEDYIPAPSSGLKRKRNAVAVVRERFAITDSLDAWINADRLPTTDPRHGCRRKVEHKFFGLDRIRA
jgi:hypothetical protein